MPQSIGMLMSDRAAAFTMVIKARQLATKVCYIAENKLGHLATKDAI
jgi:hypothetical protein